MESIHHTYRPMQRALLRPAGLALLALLVAVSMTPVAVAQTSFTVSVGPKTQNHPYFGQGWPESYRIDGVDGAELTLERGETYTFQMSGVPGKHPFYISTSEIGAGIGVWNEGVTNNFVTGNGTLTFTVPNSAPDELWYQCSSHTHMGWVLNIVGKGVGAETGVASTGLEVIGPFPNPAADSVTLLLDLAGPADVRVVISDVLGRRVLVRDVGTLEAGAGLPVVLDLGGLAPGTYVYRLEARIGGDTIVSSGQLARAP